MGNLLSITLEYARVMEMIEEAEGEITPEIESAVNSAIKDRDKFMERLCEKYFEAKASVAYIKETIENFEARAKAFEKKQEQLKNLMFSVMREFNMTKTTKGKTTYNFTSPLYTVFVKNQESVELDEALFIEKFEPIVGKTSNYVTYKITAEVTADQLRRLNQLNIIPATSMSPKLDKKEVLSYLKSISEGAQLSFDENNEITFDPIKDVTSIVTKDIVNIRK